MNELNNTIKPAIITLEHWGQELLRLLPHLAIALVVLVVFFVLGLSVRNKIKAPLHKIFSKSHSSRMLVNIGAQLAFLACLGIGVLIAASILGLDKVFTSTLTGLGVFGLGLGYALKDVAANFFAGIVIGLREPFKTGDMIIVGEHRGYVIATDILFTTIRTPDGQVIYAPNQAIYSQPVINFTKQGSRRVVFRSGVSYGDDLETVRQLMIDEVKKFDFVLKDKPIEVYFTEIGSCSYNFELRFWIAFETQKQFRNALSECIISLKKVFDAHGVSLPYPIRTLDFGVKGGVNLFDTPVQIELAKTSNNGQS